MSDLKAHDLVNVDNFTNQNLDDLTLGMSDEMRYEIEHFSCFNPPVICLQHFLNNATLDEVETAFRAAGIVI